MSILLQHLTKGCMDSLLTRYIKILGMKSPKIVDGVVDKCHYNLCHSAQAFVDGLIALDRDFIESTSTLALQEVLLPEIDELKANNTIVQFTSYLEKDLEDGNPPQRQVTISPYVIFGQDMETRLKLEDPWRYTAPLLTTNRFFAFDPIQGFSLVKFFNERIYGFNCFVHDKKQIEVIHDGQKTEYKPTNFVISFETDAKNHQFFVSDFNWMIKYKKSK